jgi:prepilin peptidase CpaA
MIPALACQPLAATMEVLFALLMVIGAGWDIACRRLPNWLTIAVAAAFIPWALAMGIGIPGFVLALIAGAICFGVGFALFHFGQMGAGDVKLIVAVALWTGFNINLVRFLLYMGIAGGLLAILFIFLRLVMKRDPGELPYGVAIVLSALVIKAGSTTCFVW